MGISCPCSKGSGDGETGIDFEEIEEDENYISMDNFFNKIPKPILDEMNSEKDFFDNHPNNTDLKTVKIQDNNISNNKDILYHGEFNQKGEKDGIGKMILTNEKNDTLYIHGIWKKDELKKGIIYYSNNTKYKGDIKNFLKHGKGIYITDSETYDGDWKDDLKDGEGYIKYKEGAEYRGHFKKDKFNGKGEMKFLDETSYSGDFYNGIFHGQGFLKGNNGHTYYGTFSKGVYNGQGEFKWSKGVKTIFYKGNYLSGKKDGQGLLQFDNGDIYWGGWESGIPNGEGIFETKNRKYHGNWRTGVFMQLIEAENKEGGEEKVNLNFTTPLEDIEIKWDFKISNNSVFSSTFNTYNDVLIEIIKQN